MVMAFSSYIKYSCNSHGVNRNYSPVKSLFGYRCQYEGANDESFLLVATEEHGQQRGVLKTPNPES